MRHAFPDHSQARYDLKMRHRAAFVNNQEISSEILIFVLKKLLVYSSKAVKEVICKTILEIRKEID